ncbi:hypothetical protein AYI69_g10399, partial [Smittium culicis]
MIYQLLQERNRDPDPEPEEPYFSA